MSQDKVNKLERERESFQLKLNISEDNSVVDPDKEWAKVMTKLSYKMPQTFKYSLVLFLGIGFVHTIGAKRASLLFLYPIIGTPILGLGLCYNDFYRMYDIKFNMPKKNH